MINTIAVIAVSVVSIILLIGMLAVLIMMQQQSVSNAKNEVFISLLIASNKKLEIAAKSTLDACEAFIDYVQHSMPHGSKTGDVMRNANFFSTDDGKIQSNNLEDFLEKLEESDEYKDVADSIRRQLEKELDENMDDDEDEDDDEPFKK